MAETAILAHITEKRLHITQLNRAIKRAIDNPDLGLIVHQLDLKSLRIIVHTYASFANLPDHKTQLGFFVLLTDDTRRVSWLHYRSYKCNRVVRSILGEEIHAFADAFDASYSIRHDLQNIMIRKVPLCILTDSDALFKVIVKSSNMTKRRLMIDIQAGCETNHNRDIDYMGWIKSKHNIADGLTNVNNL